MRLESEPTWNSIIDKMADLLLELRTSPLLERSSRGRFPAVPEQGVYVFYDSEGSPVYVGRTDRMRARIQEHGRPKARHNAATFAFMMAWDMAEAMEFDLRGAFNRDEIQHLNAFKPLFDETKAIVGRMGVRVVEITDPIEQAVFEIYAALQLQTTRAQSGYNDFNNH